MHFPQARFGRLGNFVRRFHQSDWSAPHGRRFQPRTCLRCHVGIGPRGAPRPRCQKRARKDWRPRLVTKASRAGVKRVTVGPVTAEMLTSQRRQGGVEPAAGGPYIWGLFKSPFIFSRPFAGPSRAFASFRAWGFTTVGENGFSLGLEAFKDSRSCPGTSCVL